MRKINCLPLALARLALLQTRTAGRNLRPEEDAGLPAKVRGTPRRTIRGAGNAQTARKPGADTEKTGTIYRAPTRESKSRAFAVRVTGMPR